MMPLPCRVRKSWNALGPDSGCIQLTSSPATLASATRAREERHSPR